MAQKKNQIGESGGERKKNPSGNPGDPKGQKPCFLERKIKKITCLFPSTKFVNGMPCTNIKH